LHGYVIVASLATGNPFIIYYYIHVYCIIASTIDAMCNAGVLS